MLGGDLPEPLEAVDTRVALSFFRWSSSRVWARLLFTKSKLDCMRSTTLCKRVISCRSSSQRGQVAAVWPGASELLQWAIEAEASSSSTRRRVFRPKDDCPRRTRPSIWVVTPICSASCPQFSLRAWRRFSSLSAISEFMVSEFLCVC